MGAERVWSSDAAKTMRWAMNGKKNEWVMSSTMRMWRSVPHWIYTRDGMGYGSRRKLYVKT